MMQYDIFDPEVTTGLAKCDAKTAEAFFRRYTGTIGDRVNLLQAWMANGGKHGNRQALNLDFSKESIENLQNWLDQELLNERKGPSPDRAYLLSLGTDVGMYLGECIRRKASSVEWRMFTGSKKDIAFQRPVLMGFNTPNKKYNIDCGFLAGQYVHRLLDGQPPEAGWFVKIVERGWSLA
jgi:hypothetical protein